MFLFYHSPTLFGIYRKTFTVSTGAHKFLSVNYDKYPPLLHVHQMEKNLNQLSLLSILVLEVLDHLMSLLFLLLLQELLVIHQ